MLLKIKKDINEWYSFYSNAIRNRLRRDKNLSDVMDVQAARENLGLTGDNNHTHYHDDRYKSLINTEAKTRETADADIRNQLIQIKADYQNTCAKLKSDVQVEIDKIKNLKSIENATYALNVRGLASGDWNNIVSPGAYNVSNSSWDGANYPSEAKELYKFGILEVALGTNNGTKSTIIQRFTNHQTPAITWQRVHWDSSSWTSWTRLGTHDELDTEITNVFKALRQPTMTPLVDWSAMNMAVFGSDTTIACTTYVDGVQKVVNVPQIKNLRNTNTGIFAYGGDNNNYSSGTNRPFWNGDIILKENYQNYDKIMVVLSNDSADWLTTHVWDVWDLRYMFNHAFRFDICRTGGAQYWEFTGNKRQGTRTDCRISTVKHWHGWNQNCSIVEIYGIKYSTKIADITVDTDCNCNCVINCNCNCNCDCDCDCSDDCQDGCDCDCMGDNDCAGDD